MLLIVAHHYVVNSGLMPIMELEPCSLKSIYYYLFGMWGKTGINCFVLITGYFMCHSQISIKKFLKLLLEIEFYKVIIYAVFVLSGYETFTLKDAIKALLPVRNVSTGFVSCYLLFYFFIPFLTILVNHLDKTMHKYLIYLCLLIYTILGTIPKIGVVMNYVTWFSVLFIIAAYIRNYGLFPKLKTSQWGWLSLFSVLLSVCSVLFMVRVAHGYFGLPNAPYYWVSDSNKLLALMTAVCSFMYFKDLRLRQSKIINIIASCTFGVLLIHANSDTMREWLWGDTLNNVYYYSTSAAFIRPVMVVIGVFVICSMIDYCRIRLLERPVMNYISKKLNGRIHEK